MGERLYRMARPEALRIVQLDSFIAVYHRSSGITHLITAPAPEILGELGEAGLTLAALRQRLSAHYDIGDGDEGGLEARLAELLATGLVSVA